MSFISKQLKSQIITASGTPAWTRPANVDAVMLTVVGAGGGGGGGNAANSTTGGGGGGGGAVLQTSMPVVANVDVTIGAGGAGGAAGGSGRVVITWYE